MSRRILVLSMLLVLFLVGCSGTEPTATAEPTIAPEPPTTVSEPETSAEEPETRNLLLATTTSTENSGLLAFLLPDFEDQYQVKVDVVAVGTGQALQLGMDGNADVLLVHARALEDSFMAEGHGSRRKDVMYNDFVILGPAEDPAGIQGKSQASRAFELIAQSESPFVSRGDDSGTHTKEKAIWSEAGLEPTGDWYISAGQGMGAVLSMADEGQSYTLSDRATYLARTLEGIELSILVEGDPILFNPYGVIAVNPNKGDHIQADLANSFVDWLVSLPTQEKIVQFGVAEFGAPLFTPDSAAWRKAHGGSGDQEAETAEDIALKITGAVENEMMWTEEEVRAMETMEAESTNTVGELATYIGVPMNRLLNMAGPKKGAATLILIAGDGNTAEVALSEVQRRADCIVSFRNQGGFSIVLPGFSSELQVKGVIEIQVQ